MEAVDEENEECDVAAPLTKQEAVDEEQEEAQKARRGAKEDKRRRKAAAAKSAIYDRGAADTESGHLGSTPPVKPGRIERRNTARVMVRRDKATGVVYYDPQSRCEKSSSMCIAVIALACGAIALLLVVATMGGGDAASAADAEDMQAE